MLNQGPSHTPGAPGRSATAPFKLLKLATGQLLVREGDPPGAIYVVCAGRLRVYRRDVTAIERVIDLSLVGAGELLVSLARFLENLVRRPSKLWKLHRFWRFRPNSSRTWGNIISRCCA